MAVRVLGVSGSPRRGATYRLVTSALDGARKEEGVVTTLVDLSEREINPCNGCEPCIAAGGCLIDDDMQPLYEELLTADAILLGTPVYYGGPTALCKAFMERVQGLGLREKKLRLKVGGSIAVGASRNGGQETTMAAINLWFHVNDMLPVGITAPVTQWGATGQAGVRLDDIENDWVDLKLVDERLAALDVAAMYGQKVARVAHIVQAGLEATNLDLPHPPYGYHLAEDSFASE